MNLRDGLDITDTQWEELKKLFRQPRLRAPAYYLSQRTRIPAQIAQTVMLRLADVLAKGTPSRQVLWMDFYHCEEHASFCTLADEQELMPDTCPDCEEPVTTSDLHWNLIIRIIGGIDLDCPEGPPSPRQTQASFVGCYLAGSVTDPRKEIDDAIDAWHSGNSEMSLAAFLGMSDEEYERFVAKPETLLAILDARKGVHP